MCISKESINDANKAIGTMPIKGKDYAPVNQRIKAFRMVCPDGTITTDIVELTEDRVLMKATVLDENGRVLATGYAEEIKTKGNYINATSYIENCETSAVGRALGFMGLGVDTSVCSAEELTQAVSTQEYLKDKEKTAAPKKPEKISQQQLKTLADKLAEKKLDYQVILGAYSLKQLKDMDTVQYESCMRRLEKTKEK